MNLRFGGQISRCFSAFLIMIILSSAARAEEADPYLAYEERESKMALAWAEKENERTLKALTSDPRYEEFYDALLKIADSPDRLIYPSFFHNSELVRNFWRDEKNPQGIIRQSTVENFFSGDYQWQTVFDLDQLSARESKTLVLKGVTYPFNQSDRALLRLSDGGADAAEIREYDFTRQSFVEDGFRLPESKSQALWLDRNNLLVASAFESDELTESGYARQVKLWRRGTPWADAVTIFEVGQADVEVTLYDAEIHENEHVPILVRLIDFFNFEYYFYLDGQARRLNLPPGLRLEEVGDGRFFASLRQDLKIGASDLKQGSVVYGLVDDFLKPGNENGLELLFEPDGSTFYKSILAVSRDVYLNTIENVQSKIYQYRLEGDLFQRRPVPVAPMSMVNLIPTAGDRNFVLVEQSGFLSPTTLYRLDSDSLALSELQRQTQWFDPENYVVRQDFAISADQSRVPYFMVHRKDLPLDGRNPVWQYGYGGFEFSLFPRYIPGSEFTWLRRGGVYVLANIRGGGEYGPAWHQAAIKANRHKAFEDFFAVSEDLIQKKISSRGLIGIEGGSNGGLLTGVALTRRPDLYGAVVIDVPLLDMLRYHLLPPGSSWMAEYGDPEDPEEHRILAAYSPYQHLKADAPYPAPFLLTSTRDDRVSPGHARKFALKLGALGHDYYYFENIEGGHGSGANNAQTVRSQALTWTYFCEKLMDRPKP